jgi:hypothetical protein
LSHAPSPHLFTFYNYTAKTKLLFKGIYHVGFEAVWFCEAWL